MSMAAGRVGGGDEVVHGFLAIRRVIHGSPIPGWIGNLGDVVEGGRSAEALVWEQ
jgi:hypothetical protein